MLEITGHIKIPESELGMTFIRASGPGGQHVNKVSTAVQLRFDLRGSPSVPPGVKERVARLAGSRLSDDGVLMIEAKRFRSQLRNREDAVERFVELVRRAVVPPKSRRKTKPSAGAKRRRLEGKQQRSHTKRLRRRPGKDE